MSSNEPEPLVSRDLSSDNLLAAIVESSNDAIISKSIDGVIQTWNRAAEQMFDFTAAEAIGQPITLIVPAHLHSEESEILRKLKAGERIQNFETQRLRSDGELREVSLTISPIRNQQGEIISASIIARDISERKRVETALQESDMRFRLMADNISQFAWMADAKGWIFWYNQRWYDYTGTTLEEMQGWGWQQVHHPDHIDRVVAKIQHAWDTGEAWEDTFPLRGKDGEYRWFLSRALPIRDDSGAVVCWFGTNTDVTQQREAEQALRAADERKNEFLAMLAHELRNPLAPIRFGVDLMAREGKLEPDQIEIVQLQLAQLVRLVDDLLDVSRIMSGKVELRTAPVELNTLLQRAAEGFRDRVAQRKQSLKITLPDQPIWLNADGVRLTQVIGNLLNNASKYSDEGTSIALQMQPAGSEVEISVKDEGVGIEPEVMPTVFDLFSQAPRSIDRSEGGLGIGLTVVKELVEQQGGQVQVASLGVGRGSTFTVKLPVLDPKEVPEPKVEDGKQRSALPSRLRILAVDDNRGASHMLTKLLEKLGEHEIETADDGPSALEKALEWKPDLAILDIGLPGKDGFEVARQIRQSLPHESIFLVALTGYSQAEDRRKAESIGFDHYLVKPAGIDDLEQLLLMVAEKQSK